MTSRTVLEFTWSVRECESGVIDSSKLRPLQRSVSGWALSSRETAEQLSAPKFREFNFCLFLTFIKNKYSLYFCSQSCVFYTMYVNACKCLFDVSDLQ